MSSDSAPPPIGVFVTVKVPTEVQEEFLTIMQLDLVETRKEEGCVKFDLLDQGEGVYSLYEVYTSSEAFDFHKTTPHYNSWVEFKSRNPFVAGSQNVVRFTSLSPYAPKSGKKEKKAKEPKAKVEEKPKEAPMDEAAKAAAAEAKAAEKLLAKCIKEGGKKGVEIEGAADMGGLDFFCTTMEFPDGDMELLQTAMDAMNAMPEEGAEDRKGCSGRVGKMIFSAGVKQLGIVAYVPENFAGKVDVTEWAQHVCDQVAGKITVPAEKAVSPDGGLVISATVQADADKGKFPLKDKDTAMAVSFQFLREKGCFPEDKGDDDDDECCFGDDAFDNIEDL